jgi:translation initiation factor 3 subunit C
MCAVVLPGDWRRAIFYATALSCWSLLPQKEAVLAMLRQKLQEEGLRTYLLSYGRFYSSLSIVQLCDMFELPKAKV